MVIMPEMGHMSRRKMRTPVGHRYLEALHAQMSIPLNSSNVFIGGSGRSDRSDDLDLTVLGITSGMDMNEIDFALCRFTQASPETPLHLDILQVRSCLRAVFSAARSAD